MKLVILFLTLGVITPDSAVFNIAENLYQKGDYKSASRELLNFLKTYPYSRHRDEAVYLLGKSLVNLSQLRRAEKVWSFFVKVRTGSVWAERGIYELIVLKTYLGDWDSAKQTLQIFRKKFPASELVKTAEVVVKKYGGEKVKVPKVMAGEESMGGDEVLSGSIEDEKRLEEGKSGEAGSEVKEQVGMEKRSGEGQKSFEDRERIRGKQGRVEAETERRERLKRRTPDRKKTDENLEECKGEGNNEENNVERESVQPSDNEEVDRVETVEVGEVEVKRRKKSKIIRGYGTEFQRVRTPETKTTQATRVTCQPAPVGRQEERILKEIVESKIKDIKKSVDEVVEEKKKLDEAKKERNELKRILEMKAKLLELKERAVKLREKIITGELTE